MINRGLLEDLSNEAEGLLSLYEAAHLRVHGEDILEEALAFTTCHLEHLKTQVQDLLATITITSPSLITLILEMSYTIYNPIL